MQQWLALLSQSFPLSPPHFTLDHIPNLSGKVVLVTGGNTGIGKETVRALLVHNATVYLAARSPDKAQAAIADLKADTGKQAIFLKLDLANLASVRAAASQFLASETQLHILFNNAGVMWPSHSELTKDGFDLQFGTNVVGHYLLTKLLLPALLLPRCYTLEFISARARRDRMTTYELYNQSKHANVVFARELGRRYGDQGIISTAVNPGNIRSELQRHLNPVARFVARLFLYPTPYGALNQLWAGTSPETADFNGKFIVPWTRIGECRPEASDPENGRRLWDYLMQGTGL